MKKAEFRTPNAMLFESDHKGFNRQVTLISHGNVWGGCQYSNHIRPYLETECNGFTREPGHLRDFDLGGFKDLPAHVRRFVLEATKGHDSVWLYEFRSFYKPGYWERRRKVVHGYVVTSYDHKLLRAFYTGPTWKSESVINEAIKYITD